MCSYTASANECPVADTSWYKGGQAQLEEASVLGAVDLLYLPEPLSDEQEPYLNSLSAGYFLSSSRRVMSNDNRADQGAAPEYVLLIAFLTPPLLALATKAQRPPASQLHWTSHASSCSSRISCWKDANTLYSQKHSRPS
ncbi:hypothetical protein [Agarivorans litoreus]|uniref:hypothetical protein n=1 Tax=Agarivorans litoreus TaxID=1510455 RepID=UPI001C7CC471|nr:hypothetical protein [Agarivorans litoreus]